MRSLTIFLSLAYAACFQPFSRVSGLQKTISPPSTAASLPNEKASRWTQNVVAFVAPAFLAGLLTFTPAQAMDSSVFNNEYADPFHPYCKRKIEVSKDGKTFHYSGTAVGPKAEDGPLRGCSPQEVKLYKLRQGAFDGEILDSNRISAGDGIHEGVWEPKNTATTHLGYEDVDGIRWNDGNKWVVLSQSSVQKNRDGKFVVTKKPVSVVAGEVIFYSYIGFSTLAGVKGLSDGIKRKQQKS